MQLRLPYPATPRHAPELARVVVEALRRVEDTVLDFSPQSLLRVDAVLRRYWTSDVAPETIAETLFCLGCYVGEVLMRLRGGCWREPSAAERHALGPWMLVVLPDGTTCNPIGRVFKFVRRGPDESVAYFVHTLAGRPSGPACLGEAQSVAASTARPTM